MNRRRTLSPVESVNRLFEPRHLRVPLLILAAVLSSLAVGAQEEPAKERLATATVVGSTVDVYPEIATREVRPSANTVIPPGFPLGEPQFSIKAGEKVDLLDIFPNDGESQFTCKIRRRSGQIGFVECFFLEMQEWFGDRGSLVRILMEQPYEYEGNFAGPLEDMERLNKFITQFPSSPFVPFARLEILGLRCSMSSLLVQNVWGSLKELKDYGTLDEPVEIPWSTKSRQLYSSLEKQEFERLRPIHDVCSLVTELKRSVPAPIGFAEER